MNKKYVEEIYKLLKKAVVSGYKSGIRSVVKQNKDLRYVKENVKYSTSYTATDEEAVKNFLTEAFEVAGVGTIELEKKLKESGEKYMRGEIKSNDDLELEVRRLMLEYGIGLASQPPGGWIKTNIDTAIVSATNAARWNRLNEKGVTELYPALQYKTQQDAAVRDEHAALEGAIYRKDDPIWNTIYPPNGWNCRCYVKPVGITEMNDVTVSTTSEEYRKQIKETIDENFRRNAGETDSIWGKWLKQKYRDMTEDDVREIKKMLKENVQ